MASALGVWLSKYHVDAATLFMIRFALMKVVCSPDKFRGSLTAHQAAQAMAGGIRRALPDADVQLIPLSDGGEGFLDVLASGLRAEIEHAEAGNPLFGNRISIPFALNPDRSLALIESAQAIGLQLIPAEHRNPVYVSSFSLGRVMLQVLDCGAEHMVIGLGGSATCDGGAGMLQALGVIFEDHAGQVISEPMTGGLLLRVARIHLDRLDPRLCDIRLTVACDVNHPLLGEQGTARIFAPQKGAGPEDVLWLEQGLANLSGRYLDAFGCQVGPFPGHGAAGGLGAALSLLPNSTLTPGGAWVIEQLNIADALRGANACLTGEGCMDATTLQGKLCHQIALLGQRLGVPVHALVGENTNSEADNRKAGFESVSVIGNRLPPTTRIERAGELLEAEAQSWAAGLGAAFASQPAP